MSRDDEDSEELETKASKLIDEGASDDAQLDEAANILAKAERLKGPLDKSKSSLKPDPKDQATNDSKKSTDPKTESKGGAGEKAAAGSGAANGSRAKMRETSPAPDTAVAASTDMGSDAVSVPITEAGPGPGNVADSPTD